MQQKKEKYSHQIYFEITLKSSYQKIYKKKWLWYMYFILLNSHILFS